jgi:Uncharacterized protein conserved in bacteria
MDKSVSRLTILIVILLCAAQCCLVPQARAQAGLSNSLNLYKSAKYQEAAEAFSTYIQSNPTDINAYTYLANCYFQLRKQNEAIKTYWYVVRNFPSHKRAFEIREFLKKNDPQYVQHAGDSSFGRTASLATVKLTGDAAANIKRTLAPARSKAEIVNELLKTVRPLKGRPPVSDTMISNAQGVLKSYPDGFLQLMSLRRIKVVLTPTTIDHNPGVENTQPRGYEDGTTFKDCPGFYNGRELVVCEYTIGNGFDVKRLDDPMGTLRHEMGHCIDHLLGDITDTDEFKHAYYLDTGAINDEGVRNRISYYLQKSSGGPSEAFAELCCYKYGGRGADSRNSTCALLHANMKLTTAIIDRKLAALE